MRNSRVVSDQQFLAELHSWAETARMPKTPPLAQTVSRRIATDPSLLHAKSIPRRWRDRRVLIWALNATMVATALVVAAAVALSPKSSPHMSAGALLQRAASVQPRGDLVRQSFRVHVTTNGQTQSGIVNVWEGEFGQTYTVIAVQRHFGAPAARFVDVNGNVSRTWTSHGALSDTVLQGLIRALATGLDGRLIADKVLEARAHDWKATVVGDRMIDGRRVVVLHLTRASNQQISLAFALSSYRLVQVATATCVAELASTERFSRDATPELISTYLQSATKPNPQPGVYAY